MFYLYNKYTKLNNKINIPFIIILLIIQYYKVFVMNQEECIKNLNEDKSNYYYDNDKE